MVEPVIVRIEEGRSVTQREAHGLGVAIYVALKAHVEPEMSDPEEYLAAAILEAIDPMDRSECPDEVTEDRKSLRAAAHKYLKHFESVNGGGEFDYLVRDEG